MGNIRNLNIKPLVEKYKTPIFFELGSGYGTGIYNALGLPFLRILSIEIDKEQCELLSKFFRFDNRVTIINGLTRDALKEILPQIPINIPIFIFLDSHFPGADLGKSDFDSEKDENIRMPLWEELNIIKELRVDKGAKDVLLIDDIMLYDDDHEYQASSQKKDMKILPIQHRNYLPKILDLYRPTHKDSILYTEQGWLILEPK